MDENPPIDIVYPIKDNTADTRELIYSLRSIAKHLTGVGRVFIVSNRLPHMVSPETVTLIKATDCQPEKDMNILWKLLVAAKDDRVSSSFVMLNDDHFMLRNADARKIPPYNKGVLHNTPRAKKSDRYAQRLRHTSKALIARGLNDIHFDVHTPIIYNRRKFVEMTETFPWQDRPGYVVKSLYGNFNNFPASHTIKDLKFTGENSRDHIRTQIASRFCFSTIETHLTPAVMRILGELYPEPSPWEFKANLRPTRFYIPDMAHYRRYLRPLFPDLKPIIIERGSATGQEAGIIHAENDQDAMLLSVSPSINPISQEDYEIMLSRTRQSPLAM